ncbi:hypothetical protein PGT21_002603 [Puccinia graminis f. sp. tritici]|uniref:Uncharacterized protein n=1 Tax=Puccinia graminis f. sp. tritici TaxID=56615 RepID=A0A5B0SBW8_PUCGR|nr:hypothetical protein PGT21_002603 [Puccinia graminis f. sp. tritici]KAA1135631.1 hypothetical protein PGTUg99_027352 [Puccinia graminis f. sp. tritici]
MAPSTLFSELSPWYRSRSVSSWTKNIPLKKNDQRSSRADQGLESFELDQRAGLFNPASCGRHSTPPSPPNHTHTHSSNSSRNKIHRQQRLNPDHRRKYISSSSPLAFWRSSRISEPHPHPKDQYSTPTTVPDVTPATGVAAEEDHRWILACGPGQPGRIRSISERSEDPTTINFHFRYRLRNMVDM